MLVLAFWLWLASLVLPPRPPRRPAGRRFNPAALPALRARKPDWVIEEVVRLKALMAEAGFTSRLFRFALRLLRIRHQKTEPHCPWQNGRVERFFGTLKGELDSWAVEGAGQLTIALADFRTWYNFVRPHRHLGGRVGQREMGKEFE